MALATILAVRGLCLLLVYDSKIVCSYNMSPAFAGLGAE